MPKLRWPAKPAKIVTLDLAPGVTVGKLRHDGFLQGFGIKHGDASIVCSQDTQGNQAKAQTAMENCLQRAPDVNVVYTINEPAAAGAYQALKSAGKEKAVLIVSVDGGCAGVKNVKAGIIAATAQQYPLKMASLGVDAGVEYAKTGRKAAGYIDTGVTLITDKPTVRRRQQGHHVRHGRVLGREVAGACVTCSRACRRLRRPAHSWRCWPLAHSSRRRRIASSPDRTSRSSCSR